ncbi:MAG: MBL fold metallo-hydrolase [Myxococcaceae bacterium]|nr:MBL fold metallo-hydrolase [Myxococcaceae bacterium]
MRKLINNPWKPLRAAILSLALVAAGCEGDQGLAGAQGEQGPKGDPGASATVDPSLNAVDKAFAGIGGKTAIQNLQGFELEISGQRWAPGESFTPDAELLQGSTYDGTRVRYDVSNNRLSINHKRTLRIFGFNTPQDYTEIINGNRGHVAGIEHLFGMPTGDLLPDRTAAIRRQTRLLNPHLILKDIAADPGIARDGGAALLDGSVHNLLVVNDAVHPLTLYVNAQTGKLSKLVTVESDHLHRDIPIEVFYVGWESVNGGPLFPKNVYLAANGHVLHIETRKSVTANPAFAESLFTFPTGASPVENAEDAARGAANHQFHMTFASFGLPLDSLLTAVVPTQLSPGVYFLGGSSHNSLAIEQENGIVIVEAPLYPERSAAIIDWAKSFAEFDGKPITHVLATHHHDDHAAGLRTFVAEGANVVLHESITSYFRQIFTNPSTIRKDRLAESPRAATFMTVPAGGALLLDDPTNPVTAYSFNTTHARDMLMFYVGGNAKVVFSSDLFNPGQGGIGDGPKELYKAITQTHNLDVTTVAGGHGATGPLADLQQAAGM